MDRFEWTRVPADQRYCVENLESRYDRAQAILDGNLIKRVTFRETEQVPTTDFEKVFRAQRDTAFGPLSLSGGPMSLGDPGGFT